jgi:hypothetical protein
VWGRFALAQTLLVEVIVVVVVVVVVVIYVQETSRRYGDVGSQEFLIQYLALKRTKNAGG